MFAVLATGVAEPVRPTLVAQTITAAPGGQMHVVGGQVLLVRDREPAGRLTVQAYRISDGEPAWQMSMPSTRDAGSILTAAGALLIMAYDDAQGAAVTVGTEPSTGRELWRRVGTWQEGAADWVLLQRERAGQTMPAIESVAAGTGKVRWTLPLSPQDLVRVAPDGIVRLSTSGPVEVRDVGTGRVLAAAEVPVPEVPSPEPGVRVVGRLLLVGGQADGRPVVTAYGLDRLDRRWQAPIDLGQEHAWDDCGDVLCVAGMDGGVRLVDAATGQTRWSNERWGRLRRAGRFLVAEEPVPRLQQEQEQSGRIVVLDPANGATVADLGRWSVTQPASDGRMVGVRFSPETSRAVIAVLDPAAHRPRMAGMADNVATCGPHRMAVACRRKDGSAVLWRLPAPNRT